jgi:NAD(P)H-nitrite reductase large subunit
MKHKDLIICRCEEVSQGEIEEAISLGLTRMDEVKRLTRAGMGLCQGKTCGRLVMGILALETKKPLEEVKPSTFRPPTRVMPLGVLAKK